MGDMSDLYTALNMFKQGVGELQAGRAVANANDQVAQIRASDMAETEKRTQLQNVSNGLVSRLSVFGTPVDRIQEIAGAVGPKQYADANAMNRDAVLTGNTQLGDMAQQSQDFADNTKFELAKIKAGNQGLLSAIRQRNLDDKETNDSEKAFEKFNKLTDTNLASSRTAFGLTGMALTKAPRIEALMGDPSKWNTANATDATLVSEGLNNLVSGGIASEHEMKALVPQTSGTWQSSLEQFLSNKPQGAQLQDFMKKYKDILGREDSQNKIKAQDVILSQATGSKQLLNMKNGQQQFKDTIAQKLSDNGLPTTSDDIIVQPGKPVTTKQMLQMQSKKELAAKGLKEAYSDPSQPGAQKAFQQFGLDPSVPYPDALKIITRKIRTGEL